MKKEDNIYYQARKKAMKFDPQLSSREGAAHATNISRDRLVQIENGTTTAYPHEILSMAAAYNAPELFNMYCTTDCPLGIKTIPKFNIPKNADRAFIRFTAEYMKLKRVESEIMDLIIKRAEDESEQIGDEHLPLLKQVAEYAVGFYVRTQELMHFVTSWI